MIDRLGDLLNEARADLEYLVKHDMDSLGIMKPSGYDNVYTFKIMIDGIRRSGCPDENILVCMTRDTINFLFGRELSDKELATPGLLFMGIPVKLDNKNRVCLLSEIGEF